MTPTEFENRINTAALESGISPGTRVAVAFSGGSDSVALLTAMHNLGYQTIALHCNFNLRGQESMRDEKFCRKLASAMGIEIRVASFDTLNEKKAGESVEMVCRRLRYEWFAVQMEETGIRHLLTGHHSDDSIETFFLNIFRGTGIRGLSGISSRNDKRCSPMLGLSREDILEYLEAKKLNYVTDSSNLECDYMRNKLRNRILPLVCDEFKDARKGVMTTIANATEVNLLLEDYIAHIHNIYVHEEKIALLELSRKEKHPAALLYYLLSPYGFNRTQTDSMLASADRNGAEFISEKFRAVITRGELELTGFGASVDLPELEIRIVPRSGITEFARDHRTLYLAAEKVSDAEALRVRHWRPTDRITPFGMGGKTRLVSDIFSDAGLSRIRKEKCPIVELGEDILWVYGHKESDLYRIGTETTEVIVVTLK